MNAQEPFLKIRFDGDSIGPGKIPVPHLLKFLTNLNKVFQRTGRVLIGDADSVHRGRQPRSVSDETALDMVLLTHGSPAAVLGFERRQTEEKFEGMDLGLEAIEKSIAGLEPIQDHGNILPDGYDTGVLMAWRDAGVLFHKGVSAIEFTLNHRQTQIVNQYTPEGFQRIQEKIQGPQTNIRTIEGRLLMADFKEHGTRCRVHPAAAEPILCLFDEEQKDEVLEDILQYVRIIGEAKENPITNKIASIKIHDIERLEDKENEATELLPQGTPLSRSFWESPSLDELAQDQNVNPMSDVKALFGTWPGEEDDGFEESINELRHQGFAGDSLP